MRRAVITHALRTPIGRFLGVFSDLSAVDLGTSVVRSVLAAAALPPGTVDEVIMGCARQAGLGPNPARQVAVRAGLPDTTTAMTVNMACGSGLRAILLAAEAVVLGHADVVVAGGMESMTRVPYLVPKARGGMKLGHQPLVDGMYRDGFDCPLAGQVMGETAETLARLHGISRREQDAFAARSQNLCEAARARGAFAAEIAPVEAGGRTGPIMVSADEHPRDGVTVESLSKLPPVFAKDGTVHAGNSSGITDGAAAVLVMAREKALALGLQPLAALRGSASAGVDPRVMGIGPVPAAAKLERTTGLAVGDFDLIELNEAFAAQVIACEREMRFQRDRLNVNGGSIALGHPIGATGARIVATLLHAMRERGAGLGLATLCISGGMGLAAAFERS